MSDYTPTTDEIRYHVEHDWEPYGHGSFDRWLAAHDEQVRAQERERIAAGVEAYRDGWRRDFDQYEQGAWQSADVLTRAVRQGTLHRQGGSDER